LRLNGKGPAHVRGAVLFGDRFSDAGGHSALSQLVAYDVTCLVVQNNMAGNLSNTQTTVTQLVSADLASAMAISGL
jgi:hypothetical protein